MFYASPHNGPVTECATFEEAIAACVTHPSDAERAQARAMLASGVRAWRFVYGFTVDEITTYDPRKEDFLGRPAIRTF